METTTNGQTLVDLAQEEQQVDDGQQQIPKLYGKHHHQPPAFDLRSNFISSGGRAAATKPTTSKIEGNLSAAGSVLPPAGHQNSTSSFNFAAKLWANLKQRSQLSATNGVESESHSTSSSEQKLRQQQRNLARLTKLLLLIIVLLVATILVLLLVGGGGDQNQSHSEPAKQSASEQTSAGRLTAAGSMSNSHFMRPHLADRQYSADDLAASLDSADDPTHDDTNHHGGDAEFDTEDEHEHNNRVVVPANRRPNNKSSRLRLADNNNHKPPRDNPEAVCMSPGCVRAAAQLLNNLDNRTDPCDDFYQFACGRFIETQLIPDEKTALTVFSQNTADLNQKLRALIEVPAGQQQQQQTSEPPIVEQMRNMYASCMNLSDIEARGDSPLLEVLRDLGGWPVTEPVDERKLDRPAINSSNWLELLVKFRQRGFSHDMIIDLSVVPDIRDSKRYIIELDQSSLGLPDRSYYFKPMNESAVAAYLRLMVDSAVMLGSQRGQAERQMLEAYRFESALARISLPREQRRNITRLYNKMHLRELYQLAPDIDWRRYLSSLLKDQELDLDRDEAIVKAPSFLRSLNRLLAETNERVLANYMIWRIVRHSMGGLSRRWRELAHAYNSATTGRQVEEPRWEQCLGSLDGTLSTALSAMYVKRHFNGAAKESALEMVEYIRQEFLRILDQIDWMDEETRAEARRKAQAIQPYIGYPDQLLDDQLVEELYSGVRMERTNYYQNIRRLRVWSTDYAFSQLRKANKRGDWRKHARAAVVNAYYNSLENSIEFPAAILKGAFFDATRPNYMNFGAIGYVIGHEITHGFDDRGRQFDLNGNDRNWWKPKTDGRFRERAQCIVDQYSNYTVEPQTGLRVNGLNTQGENIADNGGIKQAFRAYRRWTKDNGREPRLPGLELTPDQLFWLSAANIWCGKFRPEVMRLRVNSGVHSPARFRIIGPLSNSAEFAQSFNCPVGSPMNPQKKCSVW